jgi:hypothetical protein
MSACDQLLHDSLVISSTDDARATCWRWKLGERGGGKEKRRGRNLGVEVGVLVLLILYAPLCGMRSGGGDIPSK